MDAARAGPAAGGLAAVAERAAGAEALTQVVLPLCNGDASQVSERAILNIEKVVSLTIPQRAGHGHLREWHHHPIEQLAPIHPCLRSCHIARRAFALRRRVCEGAVGEPCLDRCPSPV